MDLSWMQRAMMIAVLVVAVMIHEIAHGLAALWCGDPTARERGRISLNPLRHIDPVGTLLLPGLLALAGSPVVVGWAKPVPVNLWRTRNPRSALWITAIAGPLSNLVQALLASAGLHVLVALGLGLGHGLAILLILVILINLVLMIFNLLPIPPLDGSRVVASLLPPSLASGYLGAGKYGFLFLFLLLRASALDGILYPMLDLALRWLIPGRG